MKLNQQLLIAAALSVGAQLLVAQSPLRASRTSYLTSLQYVKYEVTATPANGVFAVSGDVVYRNEGPVGYCAQLVAGLVDERGVVLQYASGGRTCLNQGSRSVPSGRTVHVDFTTQHLRAGTPTRLVAKVVSDNVRLNQTTADNLLGGVNARAP